jgi:hypothetical protein
VNEQCEEAYTDGIDEACRQVNEYLADSSAEFRFLNAGLNTVCKVSADDPDFARWEEFHAKRQAELKAAWELKNQAPHADPTDRAEAGLT